MAFVKGKFVDQDQLIKSNLDPVAGEDLARKSYVDSQAASAASAVIEDAIADGVTDKAASQNAVFDALALKADLTSLQTGSMRLIFGSPDGLSLDSSEFLTYDASIGFLLNVGGQMATRSLAQDPADPQSVIIYDKVEVFGDDGTGPAYSRIKRDYFEAKKVLPTKELSASLGFDGVDSWLGVSETTNAGNNISMSKIFPNKAQLFTVDLSAGTGPQPILPVETYDLVVKKYVDDGLATKQASLGTGTTSQYLRGDLTWHEVATSVGIAQTKIVTKGGSDVTGDGTFTKPFASIGAAMASITDASPTKRYIIKVEAGAYTESALTLKANVFIVGDLKEAVRITATSLSLDSSFTGTADNRSGLARVIINNAVNFDWAAVTSGGGKIYCTEVSFSSTLNLNGYNNASAQAQFNDCVMFGLVTISGINVGVFKDNFVFNNITLNQHSSLPSIINIDGGTCGTLRFNASVNDFNRRSAGFIRNFQSENLIVDGPSAYADYTLESGSKTGAQSLNGGNLVPLTPKLSQDLETKMLKPIANNAHNSGDWGKQWFFNFAYVHASAGTDMYVTSVMETYDSAGDTVGRSVFVQADGYGLQANVNGGNIELETAAVSGTGVRGKVQVKAKELDMTSTKIVNVADPTSAQDAATKKYVDDGIAGIDLGSKIEDFITDGVTDKAPSQNAVYDALALKLDQSTKGAANGVAELDAGGKVPSAQLPAIAITDTFVVASEAAMLALTAEKGDVAVRSDLSKSFILSAADPSVLANWVELLTPTDSVLSVNGQTGSVSLDTDDIAEGTTNKYFSDAAAKAAAVVNSTAGSETDQAASVSAMKSYVTAQMPVGKKERLVLTATDISNGYIDCAFEALADTMILMTGGVVHNEGSGDDYTLSVVAGKTRVTFEPDLAAMLLEGDDIYLQYLRLA